MTQPLRCSGTSSSSFFCFLITWLLLLCYVSPCSSQLLVPGLPGSVVRFGDVRWVATTSEDVQSNSAEEFALSLPTVVTVPSDSSLSSSSSSIARVDVTMEVLEWNLTDLSSSSSSSSLCGADPPSSASSSSSASNQTNSSQPASFCQVRSETQWTRYTIGQRTSTASSSRIPGTTSFCFPGTRSSDGGVHRAEVESLASVIARRYRLRQQFVMTAKVDTVAIGAIPSAMRTPPSVLQNDAGREDNSVPFWEGLRVGDRCIVRNDVPQLVQLGKANVTVTTNATNGEEQIRPSAERLLLGGTCELTSPNETLSTSVSSEEPFRFPVSVCGGRSNYGDSDSGGKAPSCWLASAVDRTDAPTWAPYPSSWPRILEIAVSNVSAVGPSYVALACNNNSNNNSSNSPIGRMRDTSNAPRCRSTSSLPWDMAAVTQHWGTTFVSSSSPDRERFTQLDARRALDLLLSNSMTNRSAGPPVWRSTWDATFDYTNYSATNATFSDAHFLLEDPNLSITTTASSSTSCVASTAFLSSHPVSCVIGLANPTSMQALTSSEDTAAVVPTYERLIWFVANRAMIRLESPTEVADLQAMPSGTVPSNAAAVWQRVLWGMSGGSREILFPSFSSLSSTGTQHMPDPLLYFMATPFLAPIQPTRVSMCGVNIGEVRSPATGQIEQTDPVVIVDPALPAAFGTPELSTVYAVLPLAVAKAVAGVLRNNGILQPISPYSSLPRCSVKCSNFIDDLLFLQQERHRKSTPSATEKVMESVVHRRVSIISLDPAGTTNGTTACEAMLEERILNEETCSTSSSLSAVSNASSRSPHLIQRRYRASRPFYINTATRQRIEPVQSSPFTDDISTDYFADVLGVVTRCRYVCQVKQEVSFMKAAGLMPPILLEMPNGDSGADGRLALNASAFLVQQQAAAAGTTTQMGGDRTWTVSLEIPIWESEAGSATDGLVTQYRSFMSSQSFPVTSSSTVATGPTAAETTSWNHNTTRRIATTTRRTIVAHAYHAFPETPSPHTTTTSHEAANSAPTQSMILLGPRYFWEGVVVNLSLPVLHRPSNVTVGWLSEKDWRYASASSVPSRDNVGNAYAVNKATGSVGIAVVNPLTSSILSLTTPFEFSGVCGATPACLSSDQQVFVPTLNRCLYWTCGLLYVMTLDQTTGDCSVNWNLVIALAFLFGIVVVLEVLVTMFSMYWFRPMVMAEQDAQDARHELLHGRQSGSSSAR